jgi:hypothetical protein
MIAHDNLSLPITQIFPASNLVLYAAEPLKCPENGPLPVLSHSSQSGA